MRNLLIVSICCAAAVLITSCKTKPAGPRKTTIAVIPKGTTHSFWKSVHAGAVKASKELGVDIIWKGAMKEDDLEGQTKVVEDIIVRGVDGIVIAPLHHGPALQIQVKNAKRNGIPTVIIDSGLGGSEYVSFVATDNFKGGQLGGEHLAKLLGGKGKVVMMRYHEGSASTENREAGFLDAMKKQSGIEVISDNQRGGDIERSMKTAENLMPKLREADGVFCPNETTTFGMLRALENAGLAGKIKFVGFDSNAKLVDALSKKHIHGLVLQDPINMGYMGVKTMVNHLKKQKVEARVDTGCTVATPENMNEEKIDGLLNPDYKKWLEEE